MVRKLKERAQNKETKKSTEKDIVCKYYPHFCKIVGHTSAACKKCEMYGTSKDEKKKALREIAAQVAILKSEGKSYFGRFLAIYFLCIFKLIYFYILSIRISILIFLVKLHLIIVRRIWIGCT